MSNLKRLCHEGFTSVFLWIDPANPLINTLIYSYYLGISSKSGDIWRPSPARGTVVHLAVHWAGVQDWVCLAGQNAWFFLGYQLWALALNQIGIVQSGFRAYLHALATYPHICTYTAVYSCAWGHVFKYMWLSIRVHLAVYPGAFANVSRCGHITLLPPDNRRPPLSCLMMRNNHRPPSPPPSIIAYPS